MTLHPCCVPILTADDSLKLFFVVETTDRIWQTSDHRICCCLRTVPGIKLYCKLIYMVQKIYNSVEVNFTVLLKSGIFGGPLPCSVAGDLSPTFPEPSLLCNKTSSCEGWLVAQRTFLEYFPVKSCWELMWGKGAGCLKQDDVLIATPFSWLVLKASPRFTKVAVTWSEVLNLGTFWDRLTWCLRT